MAERAHKPIVSRLGQPVWVGRSHNVGWPIVNHSGRQLAFAKTKPIKDLRPWEDDSQPIKSQHLLHPVLGCHSWFENRNPSSPNSRFGNEMHSRISSGMHDFSGIGEIPGNGFGFNIDTLVFMFQEP